MGAMAAAIATTTANGVTILAVANNAGFSDEKLMIVFPDLYALTWILSLR